MKNIIKQILREGLITEITVNDAWTKFYSNIEKFPLLKGDESSFNKLNDLYPRRGDNFNKGYFTWLYNLIKTNQLKEEDFYKAKEYLRLFDKFFNKIPVESRDINKFKNLNDLYNVVQEFEEGEDTMATSNKDEIRQIKQNEIDKVYEDDEWLIMVPKTERASCLIGKGTQWCTAADQSNNMFDSHNSQGPLYVMVDKYNDEKYQLHFETNQLMDATDRPVAASYFFDSIMEDSGPFEFLKEASDKFWDFVLETSVDDIASGGYSETFEEALSSDVTPNVLKKTLETLRYGEDSRGVYLGYIYEKNPYNIDKYEIEHFFEHIDTMDEYDLDAILRHLNDIEYDFDETDNESIKTFVDAKLELEKHGVELDNTYQIDKGRKLRVNRVNIGAEKPYNVTIDDNSGDMDLDTLLNLLHHGQLFENKSIIKKILRENLFSEEYDTSANMLFGYHITSESNVEAIKKTGLIVGTRKMQGSGLYGFYDYKHAMRYLMKGEVNNPVIVKFNITNPNRLLYLNMDIAKQVLGDEYHLVDQCENYFYKGIDGLLEEVNKTGLDFTRDKLISILNDIENDNTESNQRKFCFSLIPSSLNDRLSIVWNGNYGLEYRINNINIVNVIGITKIDTLTGKEVNHHQISQIDKIPDTEEFKPLKQYMIGNNLDDITKTRYILNNMQMKVRNNKEFEYYSDLIDILDNLPK